MAVNPSPLQNVREPRDLSPAIRDLQLAFQQGIISADEIAQTLQVNPLKREAQKRALESQIGSIPIQSALEQGQGLAALSQLPQREELADLQLQTAAQEAKQGLALQPAQFRIRELQTEDDLSNILALSAAKPFASRENAVAFYQANHPGSAVPEDPAELAAANQEDFKGLVEFRSALPTGKVETQVFEEIDPETFDKRRVRVTLDGRGQVRNRTVLGVTEKGEKSLTEKQANSQQFAARMAANEKYIFQLEAGGYDPTKEINYIGQIAARIPLAGRFATSAQQQYEAAKRNWIAAVLRQESGAAIAQSEYKGADHQYFPQPGDTPETLAQKAHIRQIAADRMGKAATFGLSPAQAQDILSAIAETAVPTEVKAEHEILPDDVVKAMRDKARAKLEKGQKVSDAEAADLQLQQGQTSQALGITTESPIVNVQTLEEARQLPPNVRLFRTPDGRIKTNLNYRPGGSIPEPKFIGPEG